MLPNARIMVVEDEGLIANDLAGRLQAGGYDVTAIASSVEEAMEVIRQAPPDLVLMDIRLRGALDGIEGARQVRSEFNLPVIFLTAHADAATLDRAKWTQPFGYIVKPFLHLSLTSAIEVALHKHQAEALLKQRESWLDTVIRSSPDPTVVVDYDGRIEFINPAAEQLLGLRAAAAVGMWFGEAAPISQAMPEEGADNWWSPGDATPRSLPRGSVLRQRGSQGIAVEGEIAPCFSEGKPVGAVITMRDVSIKTKEEQERRHEQKMQAVGRMAGGIAHDFNNLLTVILGYGEQLAEDLQGSQYGERARAIMSAGQSAAEISRQLLTLSQKQIAPSEKLRINTVVERAARLVQSSLGLGIELRTDLHPDAGSIRANASQMEQVMLNLILNARDAMPQGGHILISTGNYERPGLSGECSEPFVRLAIADTGSGMSPETLEHAFEPFFTSKRFGRGTGLGLAIVYGIVKDAGGEISVDSKLGLGTTFEILLPREDEAGTIEPAKHKGTPNRFGDAKTILLVEDEPLVRNFLHLYLERQGYQLLCAENGSRALSIAGEFQGHIDILITDVLMPKMDGPTLARQIAITRPETKILFCSGYANDAIDYFKAHPESEFLQKPFNMNRLLRKVEELVLPQAVH